MFRSFCVGLVFLLALFLESKVQASSKDCVQKVFQLALVSSTFILGSSSAEASIIRDSDSRAYDLWDNRWPNSRMTEIQIQLEVGGLVDQIHQNHDRFSDFFHYASSAERRDPGFWPNDRLLDSHLHPQVALAGGWNSVWLESSSVSLAESASGIVTYYDESPHTPGLYQFTTVDYTQAQWFVIVTHYAWITPEESTDTLSLLEPVFSQQALIPSPASVSLLGLAALATGSRRRPSK